MKSSTKLSLLALGVLVPAVSIPLFVKAAETNSTTSSDVTTVKKSRPAHGQKSMTEAERKAMDEKRQAHREAVDKAIEANDYSAWVTAVGADSELAKNVSADEFPTFIEAHKLMKQAQEKMKSIGLEGMGMKGHGGMERPLTE